MVYPLEVLLQLRHRQKASCPTTGSAKPVQNKNPYPRLFLGEDELQTTRLQRLAQVAARAMRPSIQSTSYGS